MRKWIIWSFGRGSFQYDILCGLILLAIFLVPSSLFNDRPDHLRIPSDPIGRGFDDDGNRVYIVKVSDAPGLAGADPEQAARAALQSALGAAEPLDVRRVEAVYDTRGALAAYSFWLGETP